MTFKLVVLNKEYWKLFTSLKSQENDAVFIMEHYESGNKIVVQYLAARFKKVDNVKLTQEAKLYFATIDGLNVHYLQHETL